MNKTFVLSGIVVFAAIFALAVSPISTAYAGNGGGGEPAQDCGGKPTYQGTSGSDYVSGLSGATSGDDVFNMKDGNDTVFDEVGYTNEGGNDIMRMGDGHDTVYSAGGNDTICLGDGDDLAYADDGYADLVKCGDGYDIVYLDPYDTTDGECEEINPVNGEF